MLFRRQYASRSPYAGGHFCRRTVPLVLRRSWRRVKEDGPGPVAVVSVAVAPVAVAPVAVAPVAVAPVAVAPVWAVP